MKQITSILLASDSLAGMDVALEKAAMVEHFSGADVCVAEVIYDIIAEEPGAVLTAEQQARLIEALKAAERNGLRNLTDPFAGRIASLDSRVVWNKDSAEGVLQAQIECGADLIVKPVSKHGGLVDYIHTPLDWSLMRKAPCAVLISRKPDWGQPQMVLAAIDVADQHHDDLNTEILRTAATLAKILGTELHTVCAYPSLGQSVNDLQVAMDYEGIKQDMHASRLERIQRLASELEQELELDITEHHVLEGKPANVIPDLANGLPATLTVVGTAARGGLKKLLLGNTAEDIIGRLNGDIVTVR
jgi:universal stress protein E